MRKAITERLSLFFIDVPALRPGTVGAYALAVVSVAVATALRAACQAESLSTKTITFPNFGCGHQSVLLFFRGGLAGLAGSAASRTPGRLWTCRGMCGRAGPAIWATAQRLRSPHPPRVKQSS
jgi:hypothetical protein